VVLCDLVLDQVVVAVGADYLDGDQTMGLKAARKCAEKKCRRFGGEGRFDGATALTHFRSSRCRTLSLFG
jgi:hypothetical protein